MLPAFSCIGWLWKSYKDRSWRHRKAYLGSALWHPWMRWFSRILWWYSPSCQRLETQVNHVIITIIQKQALLIEFTEFVLNIHLHSCLFTIHQTCLTKAHLLLIIPTIFTGFDKNLYFSCVLIGFWPFQVITSAWAMETLHTRLKNH